MKIYGYKPVFQLECRRVVLLRHFEETFDQKDCKETCDNCKRRANGDFELKVVKIATSMLQ